MEGAGGEVTLMAAAEKVIARVHTDDREGRELSFGILVSDYDTEVLVSDAGIDGLGVRIESFAPGRRLRGGDADPRFRGSAVLVNRRAIPPRPHLVSCLEVLGTTCPEAFGHRTLCGASHSARGPETWPKPPYSGWQGQGLRELTRAIDRGLKSHHPPWSPTCPCFARARTRTRCAGRNGWWDFKPPSSPW